MEIVLNSITIYDTLITVTNSLPHIANGNHFSGSRNDFAMAGLYFS